MGFYFMKCAKCGPAQLLTLFAFSLVSSSACGQTRGARLYSTAESCQVSSGLTAQECHNAYANALAELDEKSPRFRSRAECEKAFKRCMIGGFDRRRVEFEPALRGFAIKRSVTGGGTVVPVVEGDNDLLGFAALASVVSSSAFADDAGAAASGSAPGVAAQGAAIAGASLPTALSLAGGPAPEGGVPFGLWMVHSPKARLV